MTYFIWAFIFTHLTVLSVSVYLHRTLAHNALVLNVYLATMIRLYLWLGTGLVSTTWVAVHRKHHRYTDEEQDPHSPKHKGLLNVLFGGTFMYLREGKDAIAMQAYGRRCPRDWLELSLFQKYPYLGLPIWLAFLCFTFGYMGILLFIVNFLWIPIIGGGVVNGIGHSWGYRNSNTADHSANFFPLGVLMAGEELHNNHHASPGSAKFSIKWFEFDIGWAWIRVLSLLGLAHVRTS